MHMTLIRAQNWLSLQSTRAHGSMMLSHPTVSGLALQNCSTGTPAWHEKHCAVVAWQQGTGSHANSGLQPNIGSKTNPSGQTQPNVQISIQGTSSCPRVSHVVGHADAQGDHSPPENSHNS